MPYQPVTSDTSLPDFAHLRELALDNLRVSPHQRWSPREMNVISYLLGYEADQRIKRDKLDANKFDPLEDPLILMAEREFEILQVPKWPTLVAWLAPEGLINQVPLDLMAKIAYYALGQRRAEIEKDIPERILNY